MKKILLLRLRFHDGRFHGSGDWPPTPARLFQALVAATARGRHIPERSRRALEWLEKLTPPTIVAPRARQGQAFKTYVPNNDLDKVGGDPNKVSSIRTEKWIRPQFFSSNVPFFYAWTIPDNEESLAFEIGRIADRLYQFGRSVDIAWAEAEIVDEEEAEEAFRAHPGNLYRPSVVEGDLVLDCPVAGTLRGLTERFEGQLGRFTQTSHGKKVQTALRQAPPPRFQPVLYGDGTVSCVFTLSQKASVPLRRVANFTTALRAAACAKLKEALPDQTESIDRFLGGQRKFGMSATAERIRIAPLPSIGHQYADMAVRRVTVQIPSRCPLQPLDIQWAFVGLSVSDYTDSSPESEDDSELGLAVNDGMLRHYGNEQAASVWRTVTAMALPEAVQRRRTPSGKGPKNAKNGSERDREETRASIAVLQALRHEGIIEKVRSVRVQREPFHANGERVERFAEESRFSANRLWHVEICFFEPVKGPLMLGDGRYIGLGLFAPHLEGESRTWMFRIKSGLMAGADHRQLCRNLRRAVMSTVGKMDQSRALQTFVSGHHDDGSPLQNNHEHLYYAADLGHERKVLLVRATNLTRQQQSLLHKALNELDDLKAGSSGVLKLQVQRFRSDDPLLAPNRRWTSLTDYRPTRHPKSKRESKDIEDDIRQELTRHGFPAPKNVRILKVLAGPRGGLRVRFSISFHEPVAGPILLGRDCHFGGGLMENRLKS